MFSKTSFGRKEKAIVQLATLGFMYVRVYRLANHVVCVSASMFVVCLYPDDVTPLQSA